MLIIPAIDLRGGKCVRLRQGRAEEMTVFSDDPVATGLKWQAAGAKWLHVVDLDGAFSGSPQNLSAIRNLRKSLNIPIELGGGIRTLDTIESYLDLGLDRLILGTVILKDPDLAKRACTEFPGKIALGLDAKNGLLALEGWTETSRKTALEVAKSLEPLRPAALIYTDIARDGVKKGVNLAATQALAEAVNLPVIASGGVSTIADIEALLPLEAAGVVGVITGRALYDGSLDLTEAIKLAQKGSTEY
ncbi:MAG: 1-(5-phosphoribosyl)-5-[(5-phosphoribosylamino)methylideneamino]imidazole-4-carboxamide isomerase [Deltaproteobacteria bacterium]|nr:1-(5-phosphoribosyl)-5-[(5-phosphoribosylamino)methylideneamino]imidazole-4-carboxamide isomerase [Deltaproteobacteria bacterium]